MKRTRLLLPWLLVGCGAAASEKPAQAPSDVPAEPAPASEPAAASAKPAAADDEAWSGETAAKAEKPAEGTQETRTMEVIAQLVKTNRQPVRDCMDKAKKEMPDLPDMLVIHFVIDPDGKVKSAELNQERSTLKAPSVVECAITTIKSIKFPASSRRMDTTVNYPFNLK